MSSRFIDNMKYLGNQNNYRDSKKEKNKSFFRGENSVESITGNIISKNYPSSYYSYGKMPESSSNPYFSDDQPYERSYKNNDNYKSKDYKSSYEYKYSNDYKKSSNNAHKSNTDYYKSSSDYDNYQQNRNKLSSSIVSNAPDIYDKYYSGNQKEANSNEHNSSRALNSIINSTVGLVNLGNTCFMNTSLQILIHSEDFIGRLLEESFDSRRTPISLKFYYLCKEMVSSRGTSISPNEFKQKFGSKHSLFRGYGQNDTQEFCRVLLEDMNSELNKVLSKARYRELDTRNKDKKECDEEFDKLF